MGSSQSNPKLSYYGTASHPIEGQVQAFSIRGQGGRFVMKTKLTTSQQHFGLIQKIANFHNSNLLQYYGCNQKKSPLFREKDNLTIEYETYWQLLNFDLEKKIQQLKQANNCIEESILWEIMQSMLEVCIFLQKLDLYPELNTKKIQFSASKQVKFYWTDMLPNNMHRGYERYVHLNEFRHTLYSPEQLLQITRSKRKQINREKCVVFNIGMVILQAASKSSMKKAYDYQNKKFSQVCKREVLISISQKYSSQLLKVMSGLLQYFPKDRYSYSHLKRQINVHYKREGIVIQLDAQNDQKSQAPTSNQKEKEDNIEVQTLS